MSSVCTNQATFNVAVDKALKHSYKENAKKNRQVMSVVGIIALLFLVWALLLAFKSKQNRLFHILGSILVSPAYVISYYLERISQPKR